MIVNKKNKRLAPLPKTNIAPESWWLEDETSFGGPASFQVRLLLVSGRVAIIFQGRVLGLWLGLGMHQMGAPWQENAMSW